jgi:cytoplasmic iron level regulating protein YaaA (DUF328/UPF0246 family)
MTKKVVLIPCSGRKKEGGCPTYKESNLAIILGNEAYKELLKERYELAIQFGLKQGPDIFSDIEESGILFMPAYERYDGIIYQKGEFRILFPEFRGRCFIISALYGLLEANDFIRYYDLKMDDKLSSGEKVWEWWARNELNGFLEVALSKSNTTEVHDLLSNKYRSALGLWQKSNRYKVFEYSYPGLRYGSLHRRAEDLKKIISAKN